MAKGVVIIQGHPDAGGEHFCHALADAYARGAAEAGHEVRRRRAPMSAGPGDPLRQFAARFNSGIATIKKTWSC